VSFLAMSMAERGWMRVEERLSIMMDNEMAIISTWSYGLTGVLAAFFALYLASGWKVGGRSRAMFLAVSLCAVWGLLGMAFALTQNVLFLAGSMLADSLRFGGWYLFLILLMRPESADGVPSSARFGWLGGVALLLVVFGFGAQLLVVTGMDLALPAQRLSLFSIAGDERFRTVAAGATCSATSRPIFAGVSNRYVWGSAVPSCLIFTSSPMRCCSTGSTPTPSASVVSRMR
jgi:hypothetical protein